MVTRGKNGTAEPGGEDGLAQRTLALFERWRGGDDESAAIAFELYHEWLIELVQRELGPKLRSRLEPEDVVQDIGLRLLQYQPKPEDGSVERFRALLRTIAQHVVTDLHRRHFESTKRGNGVERRIVSDSRIDADPPRESVTSPSRVLERAEERALARVVVHFLPPDRGDLVALRCWFDVPFAVLSERFDVDETALRMRLLRAMEKAAAVLSKTRSALPRLDAADDEVIRLRVDGELTFAQMAVILGTSQVAACARFHQGMRRLGVLIDEPFRPLPDDWPRVLLGEEA